MPEVEEQDQPGHAGEHEDPADHLQVQPGHSRVYCEGQDRANRNQKDTYIDTHAPVVPRSAAFWKPRWLR
jgi:hypothetical protein